MCICPTSRIPSDYQAGDIVFRNRYGLALYWGAVSDGFRPRRYIIHIGAQGKLKMPFSWQMVAGILQIRVLPHMKKNFRSFYTDGVSCSPAPVLYNQHNIVTSPRPDFTSSYRHITERLCLSYKYSAGKFFNTNNLPRGCRQITISVEHAVLPPKL